MLPRFSGDILPKTIAGTVLAIADRLESLVGLFAAGCQPSSSNDHPFGLRRISYGLAHQFVTRRLEQLLVDEAVFETKEERNLWSTFITLRSKIHSDMEIDDFVEASACLLQPLEDFFNHVFVMVEDERIRKNRLALLRNISLLPKGIVDLSILPGF